MICKYLPALAAVLAMCAAPGCVRMTWRDRALQERPDRSTPELAFETFRASIRCDDPMLAYKLISEAMKERESFTELMFIAGWDSFFKKYPYARLAGNATLTETVPVGRERFRTRATAYGHTLECLWIREHYYEIHVRGREKIDGFLAELPRNLQRSPKDAGIFLAHCEDARLAGVDVADVTSFVLATEWKLLDFFEAAPAK